MTSISIAEYKKLSRVRKSTTKRRKTLSGVKVESIGESTLAMHLKSRKIQFVQEYVFNPNRKWRADFHILETNLLIEVEGGIWSNGRHTRGKGYLADMEKYNSATALGYRVLRFSTEQVKSGFAIKQIEELVG